MKIVIDRDIPYIEGVLEPFAGVEYIRGVDISPADVRDADALIVRTRTRCDRMLLEGSKVGFIATATIGSDHIDMDYCARAGIGVATSAGSNARGVLQWIAAALAYASGNQGWEPAARTIGVVGVGNVGSLVAEYATRWGFEVLCCDPPRKRAEPSAAGFVALESIAERCDIVTFHVPLNRCGEDATFHMADKGFFDSVRPGMLIINSSRGEIADTASLADAVENGRCSCVIDTWEHEPDIDRRLLSLSMLATPHIAGYSAQGKANATSMAVRAIARRFGFPLCEWYPANGIPPTVSYPISWNEMRGTIGDYLDIGAQSERLKSSPGSFETLRNNYNYRTEYF